MLWAAARLQSTHSDEQKFHLMRTLDEVLDELELHDRRILLPLIESSLENAEIKLLRDGSYPGLFFASSRLEVWNEK